VGGRGRSLGTFTETRTCRAPAGGEDGPKRARGAGVTQARRSRQNDKPGPARTRRGSKREEVRKPRKGRQSRERQAVPPAGTLRRAGPRTSVKGRASSPGEDAAPEAEPPSGGRENPKGEKAQEGIGQAAGAFGHRRGATDCRAEQSPEVASPKPGAAQAAGRGNETARGQRTAERRNGCEAGKPPEGQTPQVLVALIKKAAGPRKEKAARRLGKPEGGT